MYNALLFVVAVLLTFVSSFTEYILLKEASYDRVTMKKALFLLAEVVVVFATDLLIFCVVLPTALHIFQNVECYSTNYDEKQIL